MRHFDFQLVNPTKPWTSKSYRYVPEILDSVTLLPYSALPSNYFTINYSYVDRVLIVF